MSRLSLLSFSLVVLLSSCALLEPYSITFTTPRDSVVDPQVDTLDLVVSAPAFAYISEVDCDGVEDLDLLPVITDDMSPSAAHNLKLTALNGEPGAHCKITVTAFDESTTSSSRASITLMIQGEAVEEEVVEQEMPMQEGPVEETVVEEVMPEEEAPKEELPEESAPESDLPSPDSSEVTP